VIWTYFASPSIPQAVESSEVLYSSPVRGFGTNFIYPERHYEIWGPVSMPHLWDAAPSDKATRTKREASRGRVKRFFPFMYGGMPGMMMGGYGTGMSSASAFAANSYGGYAYPFG
jgi:hypothetical protein